MGLDVDGLTGGEISKNAPKRESVRRKSETNYRTVEVKITGNQQDGKG